MPVKVNIIKGQRFGRRTCLGEESHRGQERTIKCMCSCGRISYVLISSLLQGKSKSCGCGRITHGITKSRFYNIYININQRCYNKNHKAYKDYGAKGIECYWKTFEDFKKDMYDSYLKHVSQYGEFETTIDRINSKLGYYKENCRRATHLEQSNNLSSNHHVTYKGKCYPTLSSLCREYGIKPTTLNMRIKKYGLTIEEAIDIPILTRQQCFKKLKSFIDDDKIKGNTMSK